MNDTVLLAGRLLRAFLAGIGLVALFAFVALVVLSGQAQAQTPPTWKLIKCLPSDVFPGVGEGTPYIFFETDKVEGRVGWCRTDEAAPAGSQMWRALPYQWCVKTKCLSNPSNLNPFAVLDQIKASQDKFATAQAIASTLRIPLVAGSEDERQFQIWWSRACKKLKTAPFPVAPPNGFSTTDPPTPAQCPTEPAPPVDSWKAIGGSIFTYASGKLTGLTSKKAAAGALATCAQSQAIVGARIFCQLIGGPTNEVTEVIKP